MRSLAAIAARRCRAVALLIVCLVFSVPAVAATDVATAVRVIYPGQTISADMLKIVTLNREMPNADRAIGHLDDLIGKVATKTILPNRLIFSSAVAESAIIEAGQEIQVLYSTNSITISMEAVALEDGAKGDFIRIRNRDSARIIVGRVAEDGVVHVGAR